MALVSKFIILVDQVRPDMLDKGNWESLMTIKEIITY